MSAEKTLLLVEDQAIIAMAEAMTLSRFGYRVLKAKSGEEAVDLALGERGVDLILMDIDLGGKFDGTEAARKILAVRSVPIVFLTAHAEPEIVDKVRGITRYGYVIKNSGDFVLRTSIEMAFELFEAHQKALAREVELEAIYDNAPVIMMLMDQDRRVRKINQYAADYFDTKPASAYGKRLGDLLLCSSRGEEGCVGPEKCGNNCELQSVMKKTFEEDSSNDEAPVSLERVVNGTSSVSHYLLSAKPLLIAGERMALTTLSDVTELRRSERRENLRNSIANVFLTSPDEAMYGEVLEIILGALEGVYGLFGYIDEAGSLVVPSLTHGIWDECLMPNKTKPFPPASWGTSRWGKAIMERKTFLSDGPFNTPAGHVRIKHFLAVPIVFGDSSIGLFSAAKSTRWFTDEDKNLLEEVARFVSPILNARLQRDRHEKRIMRANKTLRMFRQATGALAQAKDETTLLRKVCDVAVNSGGYMMAMIGYAEQDAKKTIRIVASSGFGEGDVEQAGLTWADTLRGRGPSGTAIRTRATCVIPDIQAVLERDSWLDALTRRGYRSSISEPLLRDGAAFGMITLYSPELDAFGDEERDIMKELARMLAFGLTSLGSDCN